MKPIAITPQHWKFYMSIELLIPNLTLGVFFHQPSNKDQGIIAIRL